MNKTHDHSDLLARALGKIENGQETIDSFLAQIPDQAEELRPELEAALWLRGRKASLEARPGFLSASRAHLVETLRAQPAQKKAGVFERLFATPAPRNHLLEVLSLLTLIVCVVFVTHNVILMSELSLPGEPLYGVKLSLELSRLAFTFDPQDDAHLYVQMSQRRTSEIIELILDKNYQAIPQAAERLERQLQTSLTSLDEIKESNPVEGQKLSQDYEEALTTESMILSILLDTYPPEERQYIELVLQITTNGLAALQD